ncbi:hypothetical protein SacmaDRAFT_1064 [Saccharomonospora marina XMU15]|uniref:Uncharacterized protein n=2 Tax=Saccharomonospora TaxID=1851 RepID=H5XBB8_9PSEU|nr:hypothetical protein SacmaDRAFT_1064 [Saccharomonospora marina XMU15]
MSTHTVDRRRAPQVWSGAEFVRPRTTRYRKREFSQMLLNEELARARIRDWLQAAEGQRDARVARAASRWERLARWASGRSRRLTR